MKICICRLRSSVNYVEPLKHIMDSFFELLKEYVKRHPEHEWNYYNFGFNQKPQRNLEAIKQSDVIIIPSEAEFTYWIPGAIHTLDLKRSNEQLEAIKPFLDGKRVIILRSDRRDDEELYRTKVFPNINIDYKTIDEIDFGNIHGMKYHFIKRQTRLFETDRFMDFIYWGSDKRKTIDGKLSGDQRHTILKQIYKSDLNSVFIGRFYGFKRDLRWCKMVDLLPHLLSSKSTLCFNWMNPKATTSRYVEAVACGVIPFVWDNYDEDNLFVASDWQRVRSFDEYLDRYKDLEYHYKSHFEEIEQKLLVNLKTPKEYYTQFEGMLNELVL